MILNDHYFVIMIDKIKLDMNINKIGNHDITVSQLSLGGSGYFHPRRINAAFSRCKILNLAYENGINFFDTATSYAAGIDERVLGNTFKFRRESIVIATKVGNLGSIRDKFQDRYRGVYYRQNFEFSKLTSDLESSLRRLKTECVDIVYLHSPPKEVRSSPDIHRVLEKIKMKGKRSWWA